MKDHPLPAPGQPGSLSKTLLFLPDSAALPRFYDLLQAGFTVRALIQCSIRAYLSEQLGLRDQYINDKISTVFLDGKPVDNIDAAIIREGSNLALSSAMPGLVGATMRRGGYYSVLRSTISYHEPEDQQPQQEGLFRIKLFNLLLPELGPIFLERGIYVRTPELTEFLTRQPATFFQSLRGVTLEGEPVEVSSLTRPGWSGGNEWIHLVVITHNDVRSGDG